MSGYVAEPVPVSVDKELAEYLMRQMVGIQNMGASTSSTCETVREVPTTIRPGKIVNVDMQDGDKTLNGLWACVSNQTGVYAWRRYVPDARTP